MSAWKPVTYSPWAKSLLHVLCIHFDLLSFYLFFQHDRAGTVGSEYSFEKRRLGSLHCKRRIPHQPSTLSEDIKNQYHSSSESVGSSRSKSASQTYKIKNKSLNNAQLPCSNSGAIPEVTKELRFMKKPDNKNKITDDRVILVSSKKVPFMVFSSLPYTKGQRSGWFVTLF